MIDFFELEKKCKAKKRKKLIKYIFFIVLFLILLGIIFYNFSLKEKSIKHKDIKIIKQQNHKIQDTNITKQTLVKDVNKTKEIKDINISKTIKNIEPNLTIEIDFNNIINIKQKEIKNKPIKKTVKKQQTSLIQDETITFDKALFKASTYYDNHQYQKSMKWCRIASKIDNTDERVWKLYALNYDKIGQKDTAIKIIKTYLEYKKSNDLEKLLKRLQND